jgi:fatty acid desaturase
VEIEQIGGALTSRPVVGAMSDDVREARRAATGLIAIAIATLPITLFLWAAAPGGIQPMMYEPPWSVTAVPVVGAASWLFGLGWMIQIYRADPEPGERTWRYRA